MERKLIYGIQQIGVGVDDAMASFEWYATRLGADVCVFDDNNTATYMAKYMGGQAHKKRAILALNMQGGSGYEIWQYAERKPSFPAEPIQLGDTGITVALVKSNNIQESFERLKSLDVKFLSDIVEGQDGQKCFYIQDLCGNILCIKSFDHWYTQKGFDLGGTIGCVIGVSDIDQALKLYADVLGYEEVIYDKKGIFADLAGLPNGNGSFRRVLLTHKNNRIGGFSGFFGTSQIELIQATDGYKAKKIFQDRYWGDIGFIHLCFDIKNMEKLVEECAQHGFPFQVLSGKSFDMGDANGHWGYLEDPDGTLIEFVETHKVPLIKKLNFNINLTKRNPLKPLPNWLIKAMALKRVKFK